MKIQCLDEDSQEIANVEVSDEMYNTLEGIMLHTCGSTMQIMYSKPKNQLYFILNTGTNSQEIESNEHRFKITIERF